MEVKNSMTEMKNDFEGSLVEWHAFKRTSQLEDMAIETSKTEKQQEKGEGGRTGIEYLRTVGQACGLSPGTTRRRR